MSLKKKQTGIFNIFNIFNLFNLFNLYHIIKNIAFFNHIIIDYFIIYIIYSLLSNFIVRNLKFVIF